MATNPYFSQKARKEQHLYEDIVIESLRMYGQDIYYLPRDIVNENTILNEDVPSQFNSAYKVEMYIQNIDGFDGEGDLFTKFGVEIRDAATFIVARRRWSATVAQHDNDINSIRPREGDLLYLPMSNSMFQIMHVEHEQPFYQISNLPTYSMRCELFEYNDEDLDTGVEAIDNIERDYAYQYVLNMDSDGAGFEIGERVEQTLADGVVMSGEVSHWRADTKVLKLIHAGADDGNYHEFVSGRVVTGENGSVLVASIGEENNQISSNEQNDVFGDVDFLDFTESNPFGDPS
jgi:hypothetical protein